MLFASILSFIITAIMTYILYLFIGWWIAPTLPIFFCIWYALTDVIADDWGY